MTLPDHLLIAPIVLPLVAGAVLLLLDERRHALKAAIAVVTTAALAGLGLVLFAAAADGPRAYLVGNWPAPFGIVLVLDRLAALMLATTSLLALAALVFALARWHRAGPHFHTLFLLLLMGLNGAFLTGDLFNLFVFFEILLAASYGLLLHGSGAVRVRAGLHYIAVNLAASSLFLIGASLIYGVTGTLNMADLAVRVAAIAPENRGLLEAGAAILGIAFLVKAGMWPLCFWLPGAYAGAAAPVAAVFAVLSKVGVYAVLRLGPMLFGAGAGASAGFGDTWLVAGGAATVVFGAIGVLASQVLGRIVAYSVLVSSGTVLLAAGLADAGVTAGALFYMTSSTLAIGAMFLLVELVERVQDPAASVLAVTVEAFGDEEEEAAEDEVGVSVPRVLTLLGVCFSVGGLVLSGLPPLSGFVGKVALATAALAAAPADAVPPVTAAFLGLLLGSGLLTMIAMMRAGIRTFWAPIEGTVPRVGVAEFAPVAFLLLLCAGMTVAAGPLMRYAEAAARSLHAPDAYIGTVLSAPRVPPPGGAP